MKALTKTAIYNAFRSEFGKRRSDTTIIENILCYCAALRANPEHEASEIRGRREHFAANKQRIRLCCGEYGTAVINTTDMTFAIQYGNGKMFTIQPEWLDWYRKAAGYK